MNNIFPTRQYPYHRDGPTEAPLQTLGDLRALATDTLHRFIVGLDGVATAGEPPLPQPLGRADVEALSDPFAQLLRQGQPHPLTARALVSALDTSGMARQSFVVGEGLQLPRIQQNEILARQLRIVVAWKKNGQLSVLLSTAPSFDSKEIFLQVIGWDDTARQFNFYERRLGAWIYAGNSRHALSAPTRGRGPFDSHVNGALVMKELKAPWLHWSSQAAFDLPGIASNDAVQQELLFKERVGAEQLESIVRASVTRWTAVRFDDAVKQDRFVAVSDFLRQLLTSTTVNLVSSPQESALAPDDGRLRMPITPFLDTNLMFDLLGIEVDSGALSAPWSHYQKLLIDHGYELRDQNGVLAHQGDTHFAFPAFERSLEDQKAVAGLIQRGLLSKRMVACLAMVDFANPVWSPRREALLRHVPDTATHKTQGWDLDDQILASIQTSAARAGSPEEEFLNYWNTGDNWATVFGQSLDAYLKALQAQLEVWTGFESIGRLVASQRLQARKRPLIEFSLTIPQATKLPVATLRMTQQANVEEVN